MGIRRAWRHRLERSLAGRGDAFDLASLGTGAVVFAPHSDDESLGCGGTIARKVAAGAHVRIVVMTDGRNSHPEIPPDLLVATRREETLQAAASLGVRPENVTFLGFEDGALSSHLGDAALAVGKLLADSPVALFFVPYRNDGHPDHEGTFIAVVNALEALGRSAELCEYPIWAWRHWPWVRLSAPNRNEIGPWRATAKFGFGLRFARIFTATSDISEFLSLKVAALARYESQLGESIPEGAASLARLNRGDFLERFRLPVEVYRKSRLPARNRP